MEAVNDILREMCDTYAARLAAEDALDACKKAQSIYNGGEA